MTLGRIFFDLIVSGVATAGFALLFRTETRSLLPGALIGGVGYIVYDALALRSCVEGRKVPGGPSHEAVSSQIAYIQSFINGCSPSGQ